ncbi:MAG: uracil phosphoribosyltransferase [Rhodothermaeota bacterium MED-G64]|nr:MAG: uracil phosphoribosyltransferase [Rhodothermaeota bacterium MED-G64]RPF79891.1 MAG: uracil phosphoribosyltransferase [Rhodothermaceae bacterium TMED105]|tara:strand:- start:918 stop:1532 length:615 start_codon:yes stop_codon:yes gene_type:complete
MNVLDHALVHHDLCALRASASPIQIYRAASNRISTLLIAEALRGLSTTKVSVETPLSQTDGHRILEDVIAVAVLRAGLSMIDPFIQLFPEVKVAHLGYERDEESHKARHYYEKIPPLTTSSNVFICDPMLATGGTVCQCIDSFKAKGAHKIHVLSIIGAPEGVARVKNEHPEVTITLAALDSHLNEQAYIVPGLGDAGDRTYGT